MNESLIPRVEASDGGGLGAGEGESGLTTVIQFPACVPKEMVGGEGFHSIFPAGLCQPLASTDFSPVMVWSRRPLIVSQLELPCQRLVVESISQQEFPHMVSGTGRVDAKSAERVFRCQRN